MCCQWRSLAGVQHEGRAGCGQVTFAMFLRYAFVLGLLGSLSLSHLTRLLLPLNVAFPASSPLLLLRGRGGGGRQIKYSGTISVKSVRIKNILHFFALAFALFVRLLLLPLLLHLLAPFSVSVKCATTVGRSSGLVRGREGGMSSCKQWQLCF